MNIHVYFYRQSGAGEVEYAMFQRSDNPAYWQGVSGGVEAGETTRQAALRESFEEAGASGAPLYPLDTISFLPADIFAEHAAWGKDVVVCPMYFFAMPYAGQITLSEEHLCVQWLPFQPAYDLIFWHDQKTALWELHQRLLRGNLVR